MKKNVIIAFIGLMLSPITWWNDPFVNIPLSYLAARALTHFSPKLFHISFVLFYWLSNLLGIYLLYIGGGKIIKDRFSTRRQVITVIVYSILILLLSILGIVKPFLK